MRSPYSLILLFILLITVALPGCRSKQKEFTTREIEMSREKLIHLMADIELTEAALKLKQVKMPRDSVKMFAEKCYDSLYQAYGVTPEQFRENLRYYQLDMEDFQAITDSVIINLTRRKDSVSNLPKPMDTVKAKTPDTVKTKIPEAVKPKKPDAVKPKIRIK